MLPGPGTSETRCEDLLLPVSVPEPSVSGLSLRGVTDRTSPESQIKKREISK